MLESLHARAALEGFATGEPFLILRDPPDGVFWAQVLLPVVDL